MPAANDWAEASDALNSRMQTAARSRIMNATLHERPERTGKSVIAQHLLQHFARRLAPVGRHAILEPVTRQLPQPGNRNHFADRRLGLRGPGLHVILGAEELDRLP